MVLPQPGGPNRIAPGRHDVRHDKRQDERHDGGDRDNGHYGDGHDDMLVVRIEVGDSYM